MSKKLIEEDGKAHQGYAFMHIPLPEYLDMHNTKNIYGWRGEDVCCSSVNTGLYSAFKLVGNI